MCVIGAETAAAWGMSQMAANFAVGSTVMSVLGMGMQVMGSMQQGQAQKQQAEYQAAVARNNQIIANQQAADAERRGAEAEKNQRVKTQMQIGTQMAKFGGSGVELNDGSPVDIFADTAAAGEYDALTVRSNAQREAWGHRVQGMNAGAQAGLYDLQGANAERAGNMGAGASLLTGLGSIADKWYMKRYGYGGATGQSQAFAGVW